MATHPEPAIILERLAQRVSGERAGPEPMAHRVPVTAYTDPAVFQAERDALFMRLPLLVAHESQIPAPGDTLVHDWLGLPLITMRDKQGAVGTFLNVCRHRGMRLLQEPGKTCVRSLVCPYHNWTYGLDGSLRNIPLSESFADLDPSQLNLVAVPTAVRHGFIWVQATPGGRMDLDSHLAGLGSDLEAFGMAEQAFCQQSVRSIDCNWKLIQDAFLDGYHVVRLHKKTVGPFFPDSLAESDEIGKHMRSAVARNEITEAVGLPRTALQLRYHATFSYTVFPNVVLIMHPEYTSVISLFPQSPDKTTFVHSMLTPHLPRDEAERDHFARSFALIDQGVFEAEDIFVSVGAQQGMRSGANDSLIFGAFEEAATRFHALVDREIAAHRGGS